MKTHDRSAWMRRAVAIASLTILSVGVGGCELLGLSEEPPPSKKPKKKAPPKKQGKAAAAEAEAADAQAAVDEEYQRPDYPENMRRNPFQPVVEVIAPTNVVVPDVRPVEPLERFSIGQLSLVAVISETAVPKAMFIDPDGFGHVVKEGDRIGRQGGVITDIRDNEVDVQETTGEDESAEQRSRTIRLRSAEIQASSDEGDELSEAERDALERLLTTEDGRKALRGELRALAVENQAIDRQGRGERAQGLAPPPQ